MMPGGAVFPDLSALPMWAQILIYSIFGVSVSIVVILTFLGVRMGQKNIPPPSEQARVAAVIVEPSALLAATSAVRELGDDVRDLTRAVQAMTLEMARSKR